MDTTGNKLRAAKVALYRDKGKIHAKAIDGPYNRLRWAMVWLTQSIFYGACWLQWDVADQARQAVLIDIAHERLYLFDLVLWPQDALLLAIVLIVAAAALFLVTALAGRLFCGFACPQTIYTMIFSWIEARIEGDHLARLSLDRRRLDADKLWRKSLKHAVWGLFSLWTAITFVGYFTPIRELLPTVPHWDVGPWEGFWLIFYAAFTYVQAGLAREAVCQHMCPYARFQSVMFDATTRTVAYDGQRGEPRSRRQQAGQTGDCIDCGICVEVCPTGIDIRQGLQYACNNCGLCIDACNEVMTKRGTPTGLIRFAASAPQRTGRSWRLAAYGGLIGLGTLLAAWHLATRPLLTLDVLRDRGALSRESADGRIENSYTLKLGNRSAGMGNFAVEILAPAGLGIVGPTTFSVPGNSTQAVPLTLALPANTLAGGSHTVQLRVVDLANPGNTARQDTRFILP